MNKQPSILKVAPTIGRASVPYRVVHAVTLLLCLLVILAFVGFIPLGHWQDEFETVRIYQAEGYPFLLNRLFHWSPRPLSELLIYGYSLAVKSAARPLIGVSLSLTWLAFGLALLAVPVLAWKRLGTRRWSLAILLALALFCLLLLGHPVSEVFYWPIAAVAYMPVVAAISLTLWMFVLTDLSNLRTQFICAVSLVVAATSAEVGAMLVVVFCAISIGVALVRSRQHNFTLGKIAWIAVPLAASLGVLVLLYSGRVTTAAEVFGDKAIAHHFFPALRSALHRFIQETVSSDGNGLTTENVAVGAATKVLFLFAFFGITRYILSANGMSRNTFWLAVLSLSCFLTAFMTLGAAFYQFGVACCERHDTMRQCFIFIGLASAGAALAAAKKSDTEADRLRTPYVFLLLVAVLVPAVLAAPDIASDYGNYRRILDARVVNWNAGMAAGDSMVYVQVPAGKIVGGASVPDGTYTSAGDNPGLAKWIIHFFKKDKVTFVSR